MFKPSFNDQLKLISDTQLKALSSLMSTETSFKMDFNQKASQGGERGAFKQLKELQEFLQQQETLMSLKQKFGDMTKQQEQLTKLQRRV